MTQINIDKMPPGREMDKLIVEEVMGWHISRMYATPRFWNPAHHDKIHYSCDEPDEVPYYSTDIAAADLLIDWLHELGLNVTVRDDATTYVIWCDIHRPGLEPMWERLVARARAETQPLAICRAAYKAVMAREESPDDRDKKELTALELWKRWFATDGRPLCASECGGELHCFFCGGFAVSSDEQEHNASCIYVKAKALVGKETGELPVTKSILTKCPLAERWTR